MKLSPVIILRPYNVYVIDRFCMNLPVQDLSDIDCAPAGFVAWCRPLTGDLLLITQTSNQLPYPAMKQRYELIQYKKPGVNYVPGSNPKLILLQKAQNIYRYYAFRFPPSKWYGELIS